MQQEFDCLVAPRDFSRRDFVRASVGSGFAAAVLLENAHAAIKTLATACWSARSSWSLQWFKTHGAA